MTWTDTPTKRMVKDIVENATFSRVFNHLQTDASGCVDESIYFDWSTWKTILFWDISEYLEGKEWNSSEPQKERVRKMNKTKHGKYCCCKKR